jgi:hypothetical protein
MPFTIPQWANGQTVTETHLQNFTSNLATTIYSTIQTNSTITTPLHYQSTPFDYNYQTGSFSLNQMDTIPMQVNFGSEDYPCLYYDYFLFNATAGHEIRGHFELTEKERNIHFFILSSSQLRQFGNCGYGNWSWDVHAFASSYDFDWVVPTSGVYAFLFLSREFYGGSIHMTAQDYKTTLQSSTETFTTNTTYTLQSNQIALSTLTSVSSQQSPTGYFFAVLIFIVLLGFILIFIIFRMKRLR